MSRQEKQRFADYLLDEIGLIEDRFVAEADTEFRPARGFTLRRLVPLLASLILVSSLGLGLLVGNLTRKDAMPELGDREENEQDAVDTFTGTTSSAPLALRLEELREATEENRITEEALTLRDGQERIVWKYDDEAEYRTRTLSEAESKRLESALREDQGRAVPPDERPETVQIWIVSENGAVTTPCLKQTPGNVALGTLFDYDAELEPSPRFSDALCGILLEP